MNNCNNSLTQVVITQGADASFVVRIIAKETKDPVDLSNASSVVAQFLNRDGTYLSLSLTGGITIQSPATIGKLLITLSAAQTALLQNGVNSFQVTFVISGVTSVVQFSGSINVLLSLFP